MVYYGKMEFIDEPFDEEERALMEAVENSDAKPFPKEKQEQIWRDFKAAYKEGTPNTKMVSFRSNEEDMRKFKEKAYAAGIPYQTLLNSLVHRYVTGQIIIPDPV